MKNASYDLFLKLCKKSTVEGVILWNSDSPSSSPLTFIVSGNEHFSFGKKVPFWDYNSCRRSDAWSSTWPWRWQWSESSPGRPALRHERNIPADLWQMLERLEREFCWNIHPAGPQWWWVSHPPVPLEVHRQFQATHAAGCSSFGPRCLLASNAPLFPG